MNSCNEHGLNNALSQAMVFSVIAIINAWSDWMRAEHGWSPDHATLLPPTPYGSFVCIVAWQCTLNFYNVSRELITVWRVHAPCTWPCTRFDCIVAWLCTLSFNIASMDNTLPGTPWFTMKYMFGYRNLPQTYRMSVRTPKSAQILHFLVK